MRMMTMNISYDYEQLLQELKSDLAEGLIRENDVIFIVRGSEVSGYYPIMKKKFWKSKIAMMNKKLLFF